MDGSRGSPSPGVELGSLGLVACAFVRRTSLLANSQ